MKIFYDEQCFKDQTLGPAMLDGLQIVVEELIFETRELFVLKW